MNAQQKKKAARMMAQIRPEMNLKNRLEFALSIDSSRELKSRFIVNCFKWLKNRFTFTFSDVNCISVGKWVVAVDKLPHLTINCALQHGLQEVIYHPRTVCITSDFRNVINLEKGLLVNSQGNKCCSAHSLKFYRI